MQDPLTITQLDPTATEWKGGREEWFRAQRKVGEANQGVKACLALRATRIRLERELEELVRQQGMLEELRQAFGKNGVPAMIIESVLPHSCSCSCI